MGTVVDGVDDDENARRGWHRVLHETMIVDFCLREATPIILAVIVISDNEMTLYIQPGNLLGQESISGIFTSIGEISGDDTAFGVAMMAVDVIDTAGKALGRVQAAQPCTGGNEVGVGDVYEFHMRIVSECFE
jgi:hypothetical protein